MSMFASPAPPGSGIKFDDHKGALLLFDVLETVNGVKTSFGDSDAVRANVAVLDGNGAPENYEDTLIFPKILQSQLRSKVGEKVLGRLGQGNAKPGQSAPWLINEASADDITKAEAWVREHSTPTVTSAAPPF